MRTPPALRKPAQESSCLRQTNHSVKDNTPRKISLDIAGLFRKLLPTSIPRRGAGSSWNEENGHRYPLADDRSPRPETAHSRLSNSRTSVIGYLPAGIGDPVV